MNLKSTADSYLCLTDDALLTQCEVDHYRSSGPGGQKRNKTSSAVRLRHTPTGLAVTATEDRSQHVNKGRALRRLRQAIALHVRTPLNPENYLPSELLNGCKNSEERIIVGRRDQRYPAAVGEILDVLAVCGMAVSDTAKRLGVSTAALVKFIENDPKLHGQVNQMRKAAGLKNLR